MTDLSNSKVTYSLSGQGVDASLDGTVIASAPSIDEAETAAKMVIHEARLSSEIKRKKEGVTSRRTATHVKTPNGLKGTILGRTPSFWGETVTVRFSNGHVSQLPVASKDLEFITESKTEATPVEKIAAVVDAEILSADFETLKSRLTKLDEVKVFATTLARTTNLSHDELISINSNLAKARAEVEEINEVLSAQADVEEDYTSYRPAPREFEQSWLDRIASEETAPPVEEDQEERVSNFINSLSDDTLANGSLVSQIAFDRVSSETQDLDAVESFIEVSELTRQAVQASRREARKIAKTASDHALSQATDESIFL